MADNVKKGTGKAKAATKKPATAKPRKRAAKGSSATNGHSADASGFSAKGTETAVTYEQVAELAHRFWSERGGAHGHHEEDWYRAEQELHARAS